LAIYNGLLFPFTKSGTALPAPATDDDLVAASLMQIIGTTQGERVMRDDFGCGIINNVFDNNDSILQELLKLNIMTAIAKYEPRVIVHGVKFVKNSEGNGITATISYVVTATGNKSQLTQKIGGV
jgi:phage baseplate assembly protein W